MNTLLSRNFVLRDLHAYILRWKNVFVAILDSRVLWRLHGHIENNLNYKLILFINEEVNYCENTNYGIEFWFRK
jgi:hypothetical protein